MLANHSDNVLRPRGMAPKTPGARRMHDENAVTMGKKTLGGAPPRAQGNENAVLKGKQASFVTPLGGGGARAPLGMKTTNAKARNGNGAGKMVFKDNDNITRQKPKSVLAAPKLDIRSDPKPARPEPELEVASIAPELPYEPDILPMGGLSLEGLKSENLFGGYYERFLNPVDDNGRRLKELKLEEDLDKALKASEREILRDIENTNWMVADIPESQQHLEKKPISTPLSRPGSSAGSIRVRQTRAVSAMTPRPVGGTLPRARVASNPINTPSWLQPKKEVFRDASDPVKPISRTTIGYTKGRVASASMRHQPVDAMDVDSEMEDVCAAASPVRKPSGTRPQFMSIFDMTEESEDESGFKAGRQSIDYDDDDFEL